MLNMNPNAAFVTHPNGPYYAMSGQVPVPTNYWLTTLLLFMFLVVAAYFLYRIATCVEKISDSASNVIDRVGDAAEPAVGGIKSFISALCNASEIATSVFS